MFFEINQLFLFKGVNILKKEKYYKMCWKTFGKF